MIVGSIPITSFAALSIVTKKKNCHGGMWLYVSQNLELQTQVNDVWYSVQAQWSIRVPPGMTHCHMGFDHPSDILLPIGIHVV